MLKVEGCILLYSGHYWRFSVFDSSLQVEDPSQVYYHSDRQLMGNRYVVYTIIDMLFSVIGMWIGMWSMMGIGLVG